MRSPYYRRKILLIALIIASFVLLIGLVRIPNLGNSSAANLLYLRMVASVIGLVGILLMWWQVVLGFRRTASRWVMDLIWVNGLHQQIGKYGFLLISLHPLLMYSADFITGGLAALGFDLAQPYYQYRVVGIIAFTLLAVVWVVSALTRGRLTYRFWKRIHFLAYVILTLVFLHSQAIGTLLTLSQPLRTYWNFLAITFGLLVVWRIASQWGLSRYRYRLVRKVQITHNVYRYDFAPPRKLRMVPLMGQFIYLQIHPFGEAHPFTVSFYDIETGVIGVTAKQLGKFTEQLAKLSEGTPVTIDGPYGVFTREVLTTTRTPVFLAGGIGITPFLRHMFTGTRHDWYLIYGNQTVADIAYHNEIMELELEEGHYVQVLSNQEKLPSDSKLAWEKGFITADLIKKHLGADLLKYDFFVCGPPGMMKAMEKVLREAEVPRRQIMSEKFSL